MSDRGNAENVRRQELLGLASTSASLSGLCITVVALMNTFDKSLARVSIVDDIFAACSAAFLLCIYLIFWALRAGNHPVSALFMRLVDVVFLAAITSMTVAAFIMIYTIW